MRRTTWRETWVLILVATLAYGTMGLPQLLTTDTRHAQTPAMVAAAQLMAEATQVIAHRRAAAGWQPSPADPNHTGLIGEEYTPLTTTLGQLSSKRTTTNPNLAGLVVRLLGEAGVREGDRVAVSLSGSFPALNIATLAACQTMGLTVAVVESIGASTWGANEPGWTWPEMHRVLLQEGVFIPQPIAITLGAGNDLGGGLPPEGIALAERVLTAGGEAAIIRTSSRRGQVEGRLRFYQSILGTEPPRVYINVGGNAASIGAYPASEKLTSGTNLGVSADSESDDQDGVAQAYLRQGVPVINLLDARRLALQAGLPIDPIPLPPPGEGAVFAESRWPVWLARLQLTITLGLAGVAVWVRRGTGACDG